MSLDNIQLPAILVQDMYKKSLVDLDVVQQKPVSPNADAWPFLGKNDKSIVLIVNEKDAAFLPENDLTFLMGILNACKLSMTDVAVVNYARVPEMQYDSINKQLSPSVIIFFGVDPGELDFPLRFPNYKLQQYNNQTYLCAPALNVVAADKEQKVLLWGCLKTLFSV